jgi:hypothetical protein
MAVGFSNTNKPLNPRGQDASPKGYNRASLFSGKALDFDGVNDYVDCGSIEVQSFSLITNVYLDLLSNTDTLAGNWDSSNGFMLYKNASNNMFVYINSAKVQTDISQYVGNWTQFVATYDGTTAKLYANGVLINSEAYAATITYSSGSTFKVGAYGNTPGGLLNGDVAGTKLFNTALTAAQVADLYNNPEKVVPTGVDNTALKLWLPMMEGAGTTAYDGSGNGNHGTISGATYVNGIGAPVAQSAVIDWNKASNYIDKSEEFESSYWSENALLTITDDSFIAPDGSATATEIIENTLNTNHFLAQTLSVTAGDYFISVYAKKRDYDFIQLSTGGDTSRYANFNISTGATGNANGITDLIIEDAGNGWYRIGGKITTSSTSFNYFVTLIQSDVASRFQTYTGTDKGQYIWGAQATKSATLQPYLRNIGTSAITSEVLLPQGLTTGRDITGVNLFENVRKQGALNLDGNSWAEVHDNGSLDIGDFSMEAWVRFKKNGNYQVFFAKDDSSSDRSYELGLDVSQTNFFANVFGTGNGYTTSTIEDNVWYHLVSTFDISANDLNHYINGVLNRNFTLSETQSNTDAPLIIGGWYDKTNFLTNGQIAQPRIYNRALTASEVLQNYNSGKNTYK